MPLTRQTFIIQLHADDGTAVLENVRTGECVRLHDLAETTRWIEQWRNPKTEEASDEAHRDDLRGGRPRPDRLRK